MRLISKILAVAAISMATPAYADHYEFDKAHTHIAFYVNHLGFSDMLGLFTSFDGTYQFDQNHPEQSVIDVTIKPSGIRTSSELLDHVLQGSNFFQHR